MTEEIVYIAAGSARSILSGLENTVPGTRVVIVTATSSTEIDTGDPDLEKLIERVDQSSIPLILVIEASPSAIPIELIRTFHLCIAASGVVIEREEAVLTAEEAANEGLINSVCGIGELYGEARQTAENISRLAPRALEACLNSVNRGAKGDLDEGLAIELELFCKLFSTSDMREGTDAFFTKRPPKFTGR